LVFFVVDIIFILLKRFDFNKIELVVKKGKGKKMKKGDFLGRWDFLF